MFHGKIKLTGLASGNCTLGLADELESGEIEVPEPEEFGRGKRRRVQTKKFDVFVGI